MKKLFFAGTILIFGCLSVASTHTSPTPIADVATTLDRAPMSTTEKGGELLFADGTTVRIIGIS
jgi:hypothetical protein